MGKNMKDWLRFSVAFWHTFRGTRGEMWPWEDGTNSLAMAKRRMRANFEFLEKLGVDRWCFRDRDIATDAETLEETKANLDEVVALAKELQAWFFEAAVGYKKKIGFNGGGGGGGRGVVKPADASV
ncbi:xylose isomerase isoform X3 [Helianthus annuus]|uniref:xylose isomerase isoform X3 n=1 Tax=Helianthus annuus TaxID=4232 RepID=UPI000B90222F|nr:xylose isomerase isoform X3 [Helianthus annuus]XP_021983796.1 xylose isomerase isoform X3 [Helianthus annuus]